MVPSVGVEPTNFLHTKKVPCQLGHDGMMATREGLEPSSLLVNSQVLRPLELPGHGGGTSGTRTRYLSRDRRVFYSLLNYSSI